MIKRFFKRFSLAIAGATFIVGICFAVVVKAQTPPPRPPGLPGAATIELAEIKTEIVIPGSPVEQAVGDLFKGRVTDIAHYMDIVYSFLVSIVGAIAATMIMVGGFKYLTSGGDASRVSAAKKQILDALLGLILVLTSYVLLNTINPALLTFKVPNTEDILTQIAFLPWCEDLAAQTPPIDVKRVRAAAECGNIGSYPAGNTIAYCVYRGSCTLIREGTGPDKRGGKAWKTCMQVNGLDNKKIEKELNAGLDPLYGICIACAEINSEKALHLGMPQLDDVCRAWFSTVYPLQYKHNATLTDPKQIMWSYCAAHEDQPSCLQADMTCYNVDNNDDDKAGSTDCDEGDDTCGCEGYDESPTLLWTQSSGLTGLGRSGNGAEDGPANVSATTSEDDEEGPEEFYAHLGAICTLNLCRDFVNPNNHQTNFKAGCKGPGISALIPYYRAFTSDCRSNK